MSSSRCPRQDDLLEALQGGFVEPELAEHAVACTSCGELQAVASAVLDERARAVEEAPVPAAGTVLWRIRMRERRERAAQAQRWLAVGQVATLTLALALAISFFRADLVRGVRELAGAIWLSTPLLLVLAAWLLLAPVASWLVLRQK